MIRQHEKSIKLLVQRDAAIGDVLLATSVLPVLSKRYPGCTIDFETSCRDILQNNRYVDTIASSGSSNPKEYTYIFDLNDTYEQSPDLSILDAYARRVNCTTEELQPEINLSAHQKLFADSFAEKNTLGSRHLVAVQSGASFWLKAMAPDFLEMLIGEIKNSFPVLFVQLGSLEDPELKGTIDLRGKCSFLESAAVVQKCIAFVGHDSALIHVAKVMNIPVVGFFGHTEPSKRINFDKDDCIFVSELPCRFCYHKRRPPVILSFCTRQPIFWQLLDSGIQRGFGFLKKKPNRYLRYILNTVYSYQDKARNGKKTALCMRNIESQDVSARLGTWMHTLLVSNSNNNTLHSESHN